MPSRKRLSPTQIAELKKQYAALKRIRGYKPFNNDYKVESIEPIAASIDALHEQEAQLEAKLAEIRDQVVSQGNEFKSRLTGAAQQVIAQFGDDSVEIQALGRKRKSERLFGRRPKTAAAGQAGNS